MANWSVMPDPGSDTMAQDMCAPCPSVGSIGHPDSCSAPCKFNCKPTGCKDGRMCVRCHLCRWERHPYTVRAASVEATQRRAADLGWGAAWEACVTGPSAARAASAAPTPRPPAGAGEGSEKATARPLGHLTPDPPSLCQKKILESDSDDIASGAETPKEMDEQTIARLDIAEELHDKLQSVHFRQNRQHAPWAYTKAPPAWEPPQAADAEVPPPPPPFGLSGGGAAAAAPPAREMRQPPGLSLPAVREAHASPERAATAAAAQSAKQESPLIVISIGSVGHPTNCSAPCKYARRKGGCRDGAACKQCHQCLWQREHTEKPEEAPASTTFSVGTRGHPHSCGQPCKYVRRKVGCRNGASCLDCHQCLWQRKGNQETQDAAEDAWPAADAALPMYVRGGVKPPSGAGAAPLQAYDYVANLQTCGYVQGAAGSSPPPSIGSIGHPLLCAGWGCKYNSKPKGCKDGPLCLRCHLCTWRRYQH